VDEPVPPPPPLRGSYHRIEHSSYGICDVFVERTGSGVPVVCVPTAGSDTTQFHGLAGCLPDGVELICLDLPWHGKSQPAWGRAGFEYALTESDYLETLVRVVQALSLDRPIVLGASMAGAAAVRAAIRHPEVFRGAIAAQTGARVGKRTAAWFDATDVNQNIAAAEWTFGLMAPSSPKSWRDRVWWGYTRGGFRTYPTDIESYVSWDLTEELNRLDDSTPKIVLLGGAYDTTVPPDRVRDLADHIPNAEFIPMEDLGHFPHAESPHTFAKYLRDALQRLLATGP
jgi:pimeloyl-ACP methyl ester carboxylesterase